MAGYAHLPIGFETMDFKKHYRNSFSAKAKIRCLAMMHLQKGKTVQEVGAMLQQSRSSLHRWLRWLAQDGVDRLTAKVCGRGRRSKLAGVNKKEIQQAVLGLQQNRKGGAVTGREIQKFFESRWGSRYSRSGIYEALKRLGLSWVSARSIHPKADLKIQEEFKKTSGKKSKKSCRNRSHSKRLKSGFKTNTESGSKGR
jgi:transposase